MALRVVAEVLRTKRHHKGTKDTKTRKPIFMMVDTGNPIGFA